jgi:hypothetical protein
VNTITAEQATARVIVDAIDDGRIVVHLAHTDYYLHLALTVPASSVTTPPGKRIRGTIEGRALRVHPTSGGGLFVEPVNGAPRIIAGRVKAVDAEARRMLLDVGVPITLALNDDQDANALTVGGMVSGYVESGTTFTPA